MQAACNGRCKKYVLVLAQWIRSEWVSPATLPGWMQSISRGLTHSRVTSWLLHLQITHTLLSRVPAYA